MTEFLSAFGDCFGLNEARSVLTDWKVRPTGLFNRLLGGLFSPRTWQRFLESIRWDEQRLRDTLQRIVARVDAYPRAIGVIDESGHSRKGRHAAAVPGLPDEPVARTLSECVEDEAILGEGIEAWNADRNNRSKGIDWPFETSNARIKLRRLHPPITMC